MINSTVSGNSGSGDSTEGGGIFSLGGNVSLLNSTVSGNSLTGLSSRGGGIASFAGTVSLVNSTVSSNQAAAVGGGLSFNNFNNLGDEPLKIINSIVAGNTDNGTAPDVFAINAMANDMIVRAQPDRRHDRIEYYIDEQAAETF